MTVIYICREQDSGIMKLQGCNMATQERKVQNRKQNMHMWCRDGRIGPAHKPRVASSRLLKQRGVKFKQCRNRLPYSCVDWC